MGGLISSFLTLFKGKKDLRLLMVGLDNAGKSTIVTAMQLGKPLVADTKATVGFNLEEVSFENFRLKVWDISGQVKYRALWKHYYEGSNGLIFVVDAGDQGRMGEAKEEFHRVLLEQDLSSIRILVFANKQDLPGAMKAKEVGSILGIGPEHTNKVYVQESSARNNTGLLEGFTWLVHELDKLPSK